jgi:hypothetical protein
MMSWMPIIDIGHTAVMVPTAGAIAVWLISGRAWKLALCWCLIFAVGLGLVALSKIAYLGWGLELPSIRFKALSGHAWRAMAVIPVLFFVLLQGASANWRMGGFALGVALSFGLGALLVIFRFHTASEVFASWILAIAAGLVFVRMANMLPGPSVDRRAVAMSVATFLVIWGLKPSTVNHRLVDVALYLSGRDHAYRWNRHLDICAAHLPTRSQGTSTAEPHVPD